MSELVARVPLDPNANANPNPNPSPNPNPNTNTNPNPNPNQVTRVLGEEAWLRMVSNPWLGLDFGQAQTSPPTLTSSPPTLTSSTPALASSTPNPNQVSNAPAAWEEDDALRHMSDVGYLVITARVT